MSNPKNHKYDELKGNPLEEDIASETSGSLKDGFLAIGNPYAIVILSC